MVKNKMCLLILTFVSCLLSFSLQASERQETDSLRKTTQIQIDDEQIKNIGSISTGTYVAGGVLGTWIGYGLGHAVQSRFSEKGYIFLTGELLAVAVMMNTIVACAYSFGAHKSCRDDSSRIGPTFMYLGLRVWEIADLWYTPLYMDRRLQEIESGNGKPKVGIIPNQQGANLVLSWEL